MPGWQRMDTNIPSQLSYYSMTSDHVMVEESLERRGDSICKQDRYIDRDPGTNGTFMSVAILAQLNLLII